MRVTCLRGLSSVGYSDMVSPGGHTSFWEVHIYGRYSGDHASHTTAAVFLYYNIFNDNYIRHGVPNWLGTRGIIVNFTLWYFHTFMGSSFPSITDVVIPVLVCGGYVCQRHTDGSNHYWHGKRESARKHNFDETLRATGVPSTVRDEYMGDKGRHQWLRLALTGVLGDDFLCADVRRSKHNGEKIYRPNKLAIRDCFGEKIEK